MPNVGITIEGVAPMKHRNLGRLATSVALSAGLAGVAIGATPTAATATGGRVDTATPTFTHGDHITNPLFPITTNEQMLSLGVEGVVKQRQETTDVHRTQTIRWNGHDVRAITSQFVAYGDGELIETAIDSFAQADDGSVWYFGEAVTQWEAGKATGHEGSWLAGRDGPPGMIMPAHPHVGDRYRPENIPGLVFEETTVKATGLTLDGPTGKVRGAIQVEEHPADGGVETKVYAPRYGEFDAVVPDAQEHVTTALGIPADGRRGHEPDALNAMSDADQAVFRGAATGPWSGLRRQAGNVHQQWSALSGTSLPPLLVAETRDAIAELDAAVTARDRDRTALASLSVEAAALDLEEQYGDIAGVDADRITNFQRARTIHRRSGDAAAVANDTAIIRAIGDRVER